MKMSKSNTQNTWQQRWHPLLSEWVIYSAHRQERPWTGIRDKQTQVSAPEHDDSCFLCPGNTRISGDINPQYSDVFVFDNDRPSLSPDAPTRLETPAGIYRNSAATGLTRVLCYSPLHNVTLAELSLVHAQKVVKKWQLQTHELMEMQQFTSVCIFENKGELTGMSSPHPHAQVYATNFTYKSTQSHLDAAQDHFDRTRRVLFMDILDAEKQDGTRIVAENNSCIAFVPYFARFPYELIISPKQRVAHLTNLDKGSLNEFAAILHEALIRLDNLWKMPCPYLLMLHQAPVDQNDYPLFQLHVSIYPPLRTPELRKHVAAHEIGGGNFLMDKMPEATAAELKAVNSVHYKFRDKLRDKLRDKYPGTAE